MRHFLGAILCALTRHDWKPVYSQHDVIRVVCEWCLRCGAERGVTATVSYARTSVARIEPRH